MKSIVLAVALALSGVVIGQDDSLLLDITKSQELRQQAITEAYDENYMSYKYGDHDAPYVFGILKDIFSDDYTRYIYEQTNPRINQLIVSNYSLNDTILSFKDWVESSAGITNFNKNFGPKYHTEYNVIGNEESIIIINSETNTWVCQLTIFYDKFSDVNSTEWINVRSIVLQDNENGGK